MKTKSKRIAAKKPAALAEEVPVLVTTEHRGVFFGYTRDPKGPSITLRQCRNAVYWDSDVRGVLGLAATGPSSGCRIGPAAPETTLTGVTMVSQCTPEAAAAWEKAPWR